jgi:hypothetical protein
VTCHYKSKITHSPHHPKANKPKTQIEMMPCHRSHCPETAMSRCCYSPSCLHKLNNRIWRRHETLDGLDTQLVAAESAIASLTRRLKRECHQDCRLDCNNVKSARRFYDDLMEREYARHGGSNKSFHCCCRECAIGNKDREITLLRKTVGIAEDFEDLLREMHEKKKRSGHERLALK